jgi:hypothetical protein
MAWLLFATAPDQRPAVLITSGAALFVSALPVSAATSMSVSDRFCSFGCSGDYAVMDYLASFLGLMLLGVFLLAGTICVVVGRKRSRDMMDPPQHLKR